MGLCSVCETIPFHKLPFEEDPGYSHQPSIVDLAVSSTTCNLCKLILNVVIDLFDSLAEEKVKGIGSIPIGFLSAAKSKFVYGNRLGHSRFGIRQTISTGPSGAVSKIVYRSQARHAFVETILECATEFPPISHELYVSRQNCKGPVVRPWLYGNWWMLNKVAQCPYQLSGFGVRLGCGPCLEDAVGNTSQTLFYRGSGVRIFTQPFNPLWRMIPGRQLDLDSRSDSTFHKIRSWMYSCDEVHQCVPKQSFLPTRVLDLGDGLKSGTIKLLNSHGMKGQYATLSHCWGKSHTMTTTSATFHSHQEGITISELPKTFQDAVVISIRLGIQYLWIDSLCIIQGDSVDWECEASKMGDVYSNSFLTIAASTSVDTSSGCFPSRKASSYIPPDCISTGLNEIRTLNGKVQVRDPSSVSSILYMSKEWMPTSFKENPRVYQIGSFGSCFDPVEKEPLNQRGWTLQERYLSPRVVHYAADQVYFQCKASSVAEDGARFEKIHNVDSFTEYEYVSGAQAPLRTLSAIKGETPSSLNSLFTHRRLNGWNSLVELYSRRKLTYESDKLPAFSGLASFVARRTNDQYFAGLWREHLFEDLLWRVYPREEVIEHRMYEETQITYGRKLSEISFPSTYRAPSWSWASLDGSVKFEQLLSRHIKAQFVDGCVVPLGKDLFGGVKSGWLKILAPLFEVQQAIGGSSMQGRMGIQLIYSGSVSRGFAIFDRGPVLPCFALFLDSESSLLLKRSEYDFDEFQRIGIAKFFRTESQQDRLAKETLSDAWTVSEESSWGPIDVMENPVTVTII